MADEVTVETKSAWFSKINWTQVVSIVAMVLTFFGVDMPDDVKLQIVTAIGAVSAVVTWVLRTWFTTKITTASAPE